MSEYALLPLRGLAAPNAEALAEASADLYALSRRQVPGANRVRLRELAARVEDLAVRAQAVEASPNCEED